MRFELKIILAYLLGVCWSIQALGNTPDESVKVYFPVGSGRFDPAYQDNRKAMDHFINLVKEKKEANEIDSIVVIGYSSPEGTSVQNEQLALLRCLNIAEIIVEDSDVDPKKLRLAPEGVAWSLFRNIVEENLAVPSREKVMAIIDSVPTWVYDSSGAVVDGRKKQLMELDYGETFRWLSAHVFPLMRNAVAVTVYESPEKTVHEDTVRSVTADRSGLSEEPEIYDMPDGTMISEITGTTERSVISEDPEIPEATEPGEAVSILTSLKKPRHFHMGIKTNMLYDALLVPNIGAEFHLGRNLSIYGEWMYAWWDNDRRHRYWRVYGGDIGLRWWFGHRAKATPLTGHHIGIFGGILTFDFEIGDYGYMGGKPGGTLWDRSLTNAGIEYGYSLPVGKRLNIDFSVGLGYLGGNYIKYYPFDNDYYFDKEFTMHYFGPTKAEISLVWLIGPAVHDKRKGGGE